MTVTDGLGTIGQLLVTVSAVTTLIDTIPELGIVTIGKSARATDNGYNGYRFDPRGNSPHTNVVGGLKTDTLQATGAASALSFAVTGGARIDGGLRTTVQQTVALSTLGLQTYFVLSRDAKLWQNGNHAGFGNTLLTLNTSWNSNASYNLFPSDAAKIPAAYRPLTEQHIVVACSSPNVMGVGDLIIKPTGQASG